MIIYDKSDFNLEHTFDCGQCFRWNKTDDGYLGIVGNNVIFAKEYDDKIVIDCDDENFINEYFDLKRNYKEIKSFYCDDDILKKATNYGYGIRILKQDPFEALISFIISANNNIPRIKKIIEALCENFGEKIEFCEKIYYSFPNASKIAKLNEEDLGIIRSGYRAGYIIDAAKKVSEKQIDLNLVYEMEENDARDYLKQIKGVGDKVADCILLFAYQKFTVFPKDVWIKRVLNKLYGIENKDFNSFVAKKFGIFGGFAQQYLFFYSREFM